MSFQTIGVAPLRLGIASFQATFSVWVQLVGRPRSRLTPFSSGPRHCGQLSAKSVTVASDAARMLRLNGSTHDRPPAAMLAQSAVYGRRSTVAVDSHIHKELSSDNDIEVPDGRAR